jgi:uncharacterized protein (TIGR03437 family)
MRMRVSLIIVSCLFITTTMFGQIANIVVTSAASFQPGMPPPGSIGAVFCTGLQVNGTVSFSALPLLTSLAGVTVTIGGIPSPLFAVADVGGHQQINFQVPLEANFNYDGTVAVAVAQGSAQGLANVKSAYVVWASDYASVTPGEFFRVGGTQYGAFQHSRDYSPVTETNPAAPGETIIGYLTGLPPATPAPPHYLWCLNTTRQTWFPNSASKSKE